MKKTMKMLKRMTTVKMMKAKAVMVVLAAFCPEVTMMIRKTSLLASWKVENQRHLHVHLPVLSTHQLPKQRRY